MYLRGAGSSHVEKATLMLSRAFVTKALYNCQVCNNPFI